LCGGAPCARHTESSSSRRLSGSQCHHNLDCGFRISDCGKMDLRVPGLRRGEGAAVPQTGYELRVAATVGCPTLGRQIRYPATSDRKRKNSDRRRRR
jgi:hypothetical protein